MDYKEILINCPNTHFDLLMTELGDFGCDSFVEEENLLKCYIPDKEFSEGKLKQLLKSSMFKNINLLYCINQIKAQNWNAQWESSFQAIVIEDKLLIRAPFHQPDPTYGMEVIIEPKMSFGTGHHDTTWMMSRAMFDYVPAIKNNLILDMGCGTCILAIIASKLGASTVLGVDIDDWAVENSIENAGSNNIANILVEKGGAECIRGKMFNLILANINRNILLRDMPLYKESLNKGGYLFLSGFFVVDTDILINKATETGLSLEKEYNKNGWVCLILKN